MASRNVNFLTRQPPKLPQEAVDAIIEHLLKVAPDFSCSACGKDNFSVYNKLTAIPAADLGTGSFLREFYPAILTVCSNCGNAYHFVPTGDLLEKLNAIAQAQENDQV
jgi:hypothetical protein